MADATNTKTLRERALEAWSEDHQLRVDRDEESKAKRRARKAESLRKDVEKYLDIKDGLDIHFVNDEAYATLESLPGIKFMETSAAYEPRGLRARPLLDEPEGEQFREWWNNPTNARINRLPEHFVNSLVTLGGFLTELDEFGPIEIKPWPEKTASAAVATKTRFGELSVSGANAETRPFTVLACIPSGPDYDYAPTLVVEYTDVNDTANAS